MNAFSHLAAAHGDTLAELLRVLLLRDYNTRVVIMGTTLLGAAAGIVGTFLVLRGRALMSDAIAHATLPGVVIMYLVLVGLGRDGRSLPFLLAGAAATGIVGMLTVQALRSLPRVREDAALGIVLSVFFGAGVALLGVASRLGTGSAAGLDHFIYGKTASMLMRDAILCGGAALVLVIVAVVLFKEFAMIGFDADFAAVQGWPVKRLDALLMALSVGVTVIGLQSVGLILIVALLVIPPSAARLWTDRLSTHAILSAVFGAVSAYIGAAISALYANLPTGALVVLAASGIFIFGFAFGRTRGIVWRRWARVRTNRRVGRQHVLRALYEAVEARSNAEGIAFDELLAARTWNRARLRKVLRAAARDDLACQDAEDRWKLTPLGEAEARTAVRNHRLWELYLLTEADTAPALVDRSADRIEHVLDPTMIARLEQKLANDAPALVVPPNPHATA